MAIHLGRPLPDASRDLPGRRRENPPAGSLVLDGQGPGAPSLLGLAPGGVYPAAPVAGGAVRSYRTLSPLPAFAPCGASAGGLLSVALSLGSPPPGVTRHRVSVEPGLSSPRCRQSAPEGGHPAIWQFLGKPENRRRQAARRVKASRRRRVARSMAPSTFSGRKWRWNAAMTSRVGKSRMPPEPTP